ncbi:hypothetical protein [Faecalibacterium prausnitzii]|jgi:hypothetical protein|uniref:hypothetical protein n=1 Tax=Faecalibacterium prausnitzii TaxID=853 RepID=UPI00116ADD20|nr:hypothetical protein [Faecalibacterium prausnitzii]VUW92573.1 Uncharacterised protein [Faecalibacterium prausnitzii]
MERLTNPRCNGIKTGYWSPAKKEELVQHLGRYEDIGLTPEEIMTRLSAQETTIDVPAFDQIMADIFTTEKKE